VKRYTSLNDINAQGHSGARSPPAARLPVVGQGRAGTFTLNIYPAPFTTAGVNAKDLGPSGQWNPTQFCEGPLFSGLMRRLP
jgi:hypothetical protein